MPRKTEVQRVQILRHLRAYGHIRQDFALDAYGCARLAARIYDIKKQLNATGEAIIESIKGGPNEYCTYKYIPNE